MLIIQGSGVATQHRRRAGVSVDSKLYRTAPLCFDAFDVFDVFDVLDTFDVFDVVAYPLI
jgi:hypothetical protein